MNPQHVVPSWDLKTLWVTNNAEGRTDGSLTPIDPTTGKPGPAIAVDDPYNMYFSADGHSAIVVAEAMKRLDFRDPHTMALQYSIETPQCAGINHADFSIDGRFVIFTCEYQGSLTKIDLMDRKVLGYLTLSKGGMPQRKLPHPVDASSREFGWGGSATTPTRGMWAACCARAASGGTRRRPVRVPINARRSITRSPDPPAAGVTAGSSGRGPSRS